MIYLSVQKFAFYTLVWVRSRKQGHYQHYGKNWWNIEVKATQTEEDAAVKVLEYDGWSISQLEKGKAIYPWEVWEAATTIKWDLAGRSGNHFLCHNLEKGLGKSRKVPEPLSGSLWRGLDTSCISLSGPSQDKSFHLTSAFQISLKFLPLATSNPTPCRERIWGKCCSLP